MKKNIAGLLILAVVQCGCQSTFGPKAVKNTHPAYNQAIVNALDQQMLLNLVRLKYRDSTYFLEVGSVTASLSMGAAAGVDTALSTGSGSDLWMPNVGMSYSQSPTISYTPLRGEDLLKNVLSPISLEALLVMTQSGWSMRRVLGISVERINDLDNAPTASGPTPQIEPIFTKFKRLLTVLERLQKPDRLIEIGRSTGTNNRSLVVLVKSKTESREDVDELKTLLGVSKDINQFKITSNFLDVKEDSWVLRPRSIAGVLYYLSQNVEVPEAHREAGLITVTETQNGNEFDWDETPAGVLFRVRASEQRPRRAYISVPYRGVWFYIADDDLESKSTFMMLQQLFSLQAGAVQVQTPTLTIPVGG